MSWLAFALLPMIAVAVAAVTTGPPKTDREGTAPLRVIPPPPPKRTMLSGSLPTTTGSSI
jgi:hypothetical protein